MERIEKTVFISYRRTNFPWALAVWQNLAQHGYDVFIDYDGLKSGDYESALLENVRARAHFLIILTPSALERCGEPKDMMRREIETALDTKRNIVSLMLESFSFATPAIASQLTGTLEPIKRYQALNVPNEYFLEAMERLRSKFLNVALTEVTHPPSASAQLAATEQNIAAAGAPSVQERELTAQQYFERAFASSDTDEKLRLYTEAIRLNPAFAEAYNNRGVSRKEEGDLEGALEDYNRAIQFRPDDAEAYSNRGAVRKIMGDLDGALCDAHQAIELKPDSAEAYSNRAGARTAKGDLDGALDDLTLSIRLKPDSALMHFNQSLTHATMGDFDKAIGDCNGAIRLNPNYAKAYLTRGKLLERTGQSSAVLADFQQYLKLKGELTNEDAEILEHVIRYLERKL